MIDLKLFISVTFVDKYTTYSYKLSQLEIKILINNRKIVRDLYYK
jgi:hypothetical protein